MSKSQLLINEPPLQVLPSLAIAIGLNEAIVLQQLHYWLNNPKAGVERNGHKWIFNTYEEWQEGNFPFWSVSTVKRTFASLEEKLVVIAEQLDIKQRDMTKYYRINYDHLGTLEEVNLSRSNGSKRADVNNESETTTEKSEPPQDYPIEWYIQHGLPIPPHLTEKYSLEKEATNEFESALVFGELPWDSTTSWQKFKTWVIKTYQTDPQVWRKYSSWRKGKGKYDAMSNKQIRMNPQAFVDTGYLAFLAHDAMYSTEEEKVRML